MRFNRLSRRQVRCLKPGDRITEHGITAERMANGDVRYSVNIMVDGQRIHRVIGRESDGTNRTQVEEFISQPRADAKKQRLNLPKGRKIALTFDAAADLSKIAHFWQSKIAQFRRGVVPRDSVSRLSGSVELWGTGLAQRPSRVWQDNPVIHSGRSSRSRGAPLAASIRAGLQQVLMIPHPVAVAPDVDDVAVVHQTVDQSGRHHLVAEHAAPVLEALV